MLLQGTEFFRQRNFSPFHDLAPETDENCGVERIACWYSFFFYFLLTFFQFMSIFLWLSNLVIKLVYHSVHTPFMVSMHSTQVIATLSHILTWRKASARLEILPFKSIRMQVYGAYCYWHYKAYWEAGHFLTPFMCTSVFTTDPAVLLEAWRDTQCNCQLLVGVL